MKVRTSQPRSRLQQIIRIVPSGGSIRNEPHGTIGWSGH